MAFSLGGIQFDVDGIDESIFLKNILFIKRAWRRKANRWKKRWFKGLPSFHWSPDTNRLIAPLRPLRGRVLTLARHAGGRSHALRAPISWELLRGKRNGKREEEERMAMTRRDATCWKRRRLFAGKARHLSKKSSVTSRGHGKPHGAPLL